MHRVAALLAAFLIFPATASASGSGGTLAGPTAQRFTASPATVAPGAKVTFAMRATPGARVRVGFRATLASEEAGGPSIRVSGLFAGTVGTKPAPGVQP